MVTKLTGSVPEQLRLVEKHESMPSLPAGAKGLVNIDKYQHKYIIIDNLKKLLYNYINKREKDKKLKR